VDLDVFDVFTQRLLQQETANVNFYTKSLSARALGITFSSMKMDKDIELVGINNFETFPLEVSDIDVVSATSTEIDLTLNAKLFNPSPVAFADLGRMRLEIVYEGEVVGYGESALFNQNLSTPLLVGENSYQFVGKVVRSESNGAAISELMSNFANGQNSAIQLQGTESSTDVELLKGSFAELSVSAEMPGLTSDQALLRYGLNNIPFDLSWRTDDRHRDATACPDTMNNFALPVTMTLYNPFSTKLTISSGTLNVGLENAPSTVIVPAESDDNGIIVDGTGQYRFDPPYDQVLLLGNSNVENIELSPGSEERSPFTTVELSVCLDEIMDCGCNGVPDFLEERSNIDCFPGVACAPAQGCPVVPLISFVESYVGVGGVVFGGVGVPGNAQARTDGTVQAQIGECTGESDCFELEMNLNQGGVDVALAIEALDVDFPNQCI